MTTFGGDGKSTFGLPDLKSSVPVHVGGDQPGPGLSYYDLGEKSGVKTVTLLTSETPAHSHAVMAQTVDQGDNRIPGPTLNLGNSQMYSDAASPNATLDPSAVGTAGGSLPHNNMQPYLTLNFCIALRGIFPARP